MIFLLQTRVKNVISDAIDFFRLDALNFAVPLRINVDVQLTVIANVLYRLLCMRFGQVYKPHHLPDMIRHSASSPL